jgi:hypothetical protein
MYRIRSLRAERGHQHTVTLSMCGRHAIRYCYAGRVVGCSQSSNADAIRYPRGMELHKTAAKNSRVHASLFHPLVTDTRYVMFGRCRRLSDAGSDRGVAEGSKISSLLELHCPSPQW